MHYIWKRTQIKLVLKKIVKKDENICLQKEHYFLITGRHNKKLVTICTNINSIESVVYYI